MPCAAPREPQERDEAKPRAAVDWAEQRRRLLQTVGSVGAGAVLARLGLEPPRCRSQRLLPRLPAPVDLSARLALAVEAQAYDWPEVVSLVGELWRPDASYWHPLGEVEGRDRMLQLWHALQAVGQVTHIELDAPPAMVDGRVGHATGVLHFAPKVGPDLRLRFACRVEFDAEGQVVSRRDYGDLLSTGLDALLHGA